MELRARRGTQLSLQLTQARRAEPYCGLEDELGLDEQDGYLAGQAKVRPRACVNEQGSGEISVECVVEVDSDMELGELRRPGRVARAWGARATRCLRTPRRRILCKTAIKSLSIVVTKMTRA